jgi:hypothetical protein
LGDAPAAAATAAQTDWRLWVVAAVSLTGLILSIYNTCRSSRIARESRENRDKIQSLDAQHKKRVILLEEFRASVRDPVRSTLPELLILAKKFDALSKTHTSLDENHETLLKLNTEVTSILGEVYDVLMDANSSKFADGTDWTSGIDEKQDLISDQLNVALDNQKPHLARLSAISSISEQIFVLRTEVSSRIENALHSFADESSTTPAQLN